MQLSTKLWFFIGITIILALIHQYPWLSPIKDDIKNENQDINHRAIQYSDLLACKEPNRTWTESMPLNYLGPSLISSNREIFTLCPGDSLGDLENTYLVMKNCDLEMYHKDEMIWSAMSSSFNRGRYGLNAKENCACFLEQDGNLGLYSDIPPHPGTQTEAKGILNEWSSWIALNPLKTELRVEDQQFQILQTFHDNTQRLFYLSEASPKFRERFGEPRKVGSSGFVKSHVSNNPTILKMNEYLGDLDGLHLIMQTNCELHLINNNHIIWAFKLFSSGEADCTLIIEEQKWISLSKIFFGPSYPQIYSLMIPHSFKVLESQFILKDDQLTLIQTLKNGSQLIFESQPGYAIGLKLRKEPRQLAKNYVKISKSKSPFMMERMDYIGDLNGLHLILQDNCTFMLVNHQQRLWQSAASFAGPCIECFLGSSTGFKCIHGNSESYGDPGLDMFLPGDEIMLQNNHAIITVSDKKSRFSGKYFAGPNTYGGWSRQISERSLVIKAKDQKDFEFPDRSFIGDLNGVYLVMFQRNCIWVLYNQSQVLWESGKEWEPDLELPLCSLYLKYDGTLTTFYQQFSWNNHNEGENHPYEEGDLWSTKNTTKNTDPSKKLLTSELSVQNDWLWLTNTYSDRTVERFMALEGTNNFIAV